MELEGTIAAISTPLGVGGIAIVRVSGVNAVDICQKIVCLKHCERLADVESHKLNLATIKDEQGRVLDQALVCVMKQPRSYTGEDVVELQCHGGVLVAKIIVSQLVRCGARLAEGGEFTFRAVMHGKMSVDQAEAVDNIIKAQSLFQLSCATQALQGRLSERIERMKAKLLNIIAEISCRIDFPDEVEELNLADLLVDINTLANEVHQLIEDFQKFDTLRQGIKTVIVGKPNVGKSSLLNALTKSDKAIVTCHAGTTRDAIEEYVNINGVSLQLIDTAGIRQSDDVVEIMGIDKAKKLLAEAQLAIMVVDASVAMDNQDVDIIKHLEGKKVIVILNKADLSVESNFDAQQNIDFCKRHIAGCDFVKTVLQGDIFGVTQLEKAICDKFELNNLDAKEIHLCNLRQYSVLVKAREFLNKAIDGIHSAKAYDMLVVDLEQAAMLFGEITGATVQQQVVDKIFSNFCVGK